jgi:antitoxin CptB
LSLPVPSTAIQELGRLRWRCRRGMKELDLLLTRYVEEEYGRASPAVRRAFLELLEAPDPVIYAYCMGQAHPPTPILSAVIERITSNAVG